MESAFFGYGAIGDKIGFDKMKKFFYHNETGWIRTNDGISTKFTA
jgi:hypothetical protein